jgi:hypothetical protein
MAKTKEELEKGYQVIRNEFPGRFNEYELFSLIRDYRDLVEDLEQQVEASQLVIRQLVEGMEANG